MLIELEQHGLIYRRHQGVSSKKKVSYYFCIIQGYVILIRKYSNLYQSYVENQALIRKKQSYINQWTQEFGQLIISQYNFQDL